MKTTNTKLFPSKERTRELIKTGEYLSLLQQHQPILTLWKNDFDSLHGKNQIGHNLRLGIY